MKVDEGQNVYLNLNLNDSSPWTSKLFQLDQNSSELNLKPIDNNPIQLENNSCFKVGYFGLSSSKPLYGLSHEATRDPNALLGTFGVKSTQLI